MQKILRLSRDQNFIALSNIFLSIFIASISIGINAISLPSILLENGITSFLIGVSATNDIFFGVIGAILVTAITRKISVASTALGISIIHAIGIFFIFYYQNFALWLLISGITAACWISLYVVRQAWINHLISDVNRSIVISLTSTIFCLGFALGTFISNSFGALNHDALKLSSLLIAVAGILIFLVRKTQPNSMDSEVLSIKTFCSKLPNVALSRFLLDFMGGAIICLGLVFGIKIGLSTKQASLLLAAFMASGLIDIYAGYLVKKYNREKMIIIGFIAILFLSIFAALFYQNYNFLVLSFFLLGSSFALIIIATLTIVNESFAKKDLVAANGTFQAIGSLGAIFGCFLTGLALEILDFYGFFVILIGASAFYLAIRWLTGIEDKK